MVSKSASLWPLVQKPVGGCCHGAAEPSGVKLGFRVFPRDTGIKPPTSQWLDDPLYQLNYIHFCYLLCWGFVPSVFGAGEFLVDSVWDAETLLHSKRQGLSCRRWLLPSSSSPSPWQIQTRPGLDFLLLDFLSVSPSARLDLRFCSGS